MTRDMITRTKKAAAAALVAAAVAVVLMVTGQAALPVRRVVDPTIQTRS